VRISAGYVPEHDVGEASSQIDVKFHRNAWGV
jgi:hypothetical protein